MASRHPVRVLLLAICLSLVSTSLFAADGHIAGRITRANGSGIGGVIVQVIELSRVELTDADGNFRFSVPPGTYTVSFVAGDQATTEHNVVVNAGTTTRVDKKVDWNLSVAETITVYSASRRTERIVEAPSAVTVVPTEQIEAAAPTGQAPRVIENAPGVDFTQSGLYDFNFNARGFNSSLNRRILTLIDGRDPSVPFLGAQEWAALSFPIDEFAAVELVRGPGSALYGANAFSGVLNMTTKQPKLNPGGRLMLTGGDLNTRRADLRHAGGLGGEWYYRVVGGYQQSDDFSRSRNVPVREYTGPHGELLPAERVPLQDDQVDVKFGGLRLDKHFADTNVLTLEGGYATLSGPVFQTGIGRVQVTDVSHPWGRVNFNMPHWNFTTYYDARHADEQFALSSGATLLEDSHNLHGEVQTNWDFFRSRARVIGGVAWNEQEVDTHGTLMTAAKDETQQAAFGQFEVDVTPNLELVLAARWDDSTLHDPQFSPKAAIVFSPVQNHSIRYGYNEAFQRPNYSELFLRANAAANVTALAPLEAALRPLLGGVPLGFGSIPVLALGNENLDVEKIRSHELGYAGIFGGKLYLTVDYYRSKLSGFVTDLLPRVNPAYPAYQPPASLPQPVRDQILALLRQNLPAANFLMFANLPDGSPAFVLSYANAGKVDTDGGEIAFNYYVSSNWVVDFNYAIFNFDVKEAAFGDRLLPNAPEKKWNAGVGYRGQRFDAHVAYRWVDEFDWAAGIFVGTVPQYDVLNASANIRLTDNIGVGVDVTNVLDDEHYETFGGDLLSRRALGFVTVNW